MKSTVTLYEKYFLKIYTYITVEYTYAKLNSRFKTILRNIHLSILQMDM